MTRWTRKRIKRSKILYCFNNLKIFRKKFKKRLDKPTRKVYNTKSWRRRCASGADIAQPVERILGKDEVPGPNPGISSTQKVLKNMAFWALFYHFCVNMVNYDSWDLNLIDENYTVLQIVLQIL